MKNNRVLICLLSATLIATAPLTLHAEMVGTQTLLVQHLRQAADTPDWQETPRRGEELRADLRAQLQTHGVSRDFAADRVDALTDSQLQQLALKMQDLPAGGGALGLLATVLVVILLLEILGITNISRKI